MKCLIGLALAMYVFLISDPDREVKLNNDVISDSFPTPKSKPKNSVFAGVRKGSRIFLSIQLSDCTASQDSIYAEIKDLFSKHGFQIVAESQYNQFFRDEIKYLNEKNIRQYLRTKKYDQFETESLFRNHNYRLQKLQITISCRTEGTRHVVEKLKWQTITMPQQPYDTLKIFPLEKLENRSIALVYRAFVDSIKFYSR